MQDAALADDFHLGRGWYEPWRAAYLHRSATALTIAGIPLIDETARLGPLLYRHRRSQTNVHSPRLDLHGDLPVPADLALQLLAGGPDIVTLDYVPAASRLFQAAHEWRGHDRITIVPQAQAPVADCRTTYATWLAGRSKRARARWPKLEAKLTTTMGMAFEVLDGREHLDALLDECFLVEQSGWKGKQRTSIRDSPADTLFYSALAREAAIVGALRIAVLRHEGRIAAFEYGVIGGDRLFLLKAGYDERYEEFSIGHVLAALNIRHCCKDPAIAWYDTLGNGLTPAAHKLRFADTVETLYRITLFGPGWRGRVLQTHHFAHRHAKRARDKWRKRTAVVAVTRKQERRRRVGRWITLIAGGTILAWLAHALVGSAGSIIIMAAAAALAHRQMIAPIGVPVLTYHSVSPDPAWLPWSREIAVHPLTFERHLAMLARMGCRVMGTREYAGRRTGNAPMPKDAVVLHFDDGYLDNWLYVVPALVRYGFPATFFASLDFIEPGDALRGCGGDERGYMNWAELCAIEAYPLLEVEPHGVDHARVAVSDRIVGRITAENWRSLAWMQWAATPGLKHDWFRLAVPVAVPIGAPVPESALALAAPAWSNGRRETRQAMERRIESDLIRCRTEFHAHIGRFPEIFCWPENAVGAEGRSIAARLGYTATTAGRARNTDTDAPAIISRIHMGDRALGFRWIAAEALHLRAAVRLAQGNHYWYLLLAPMNLTRRIVMAVRTRFGIFA